MARDVVLSKNERLFIGRECSARGHHLGTGQQSVALDVATPTRYCFADEHLLPDDVLLSMRVLYRVSHVARLWPEEFSDLA